MRSKVYVTADTLFSISWVPAVFLARRLIAALEVVPEWFVPRPMNVWPAFAGIAFTLIPVSIGFTFTTLVSSEIVAATSGIGWMVLEASKFLRSGVIFMGIIIVGITGIALDRLIQFFQARVAPSNGKEWHMRRTNLLITGLMVLATSAAYAGGANEAASANTLPEEVVIGFQTIPNGEIIAKDMGWHEESFGVPVRWIQVDSGRDLNTGIASGSIDLGLGGSSTTVAAIAQGLPGEVIWIYDIIGDNAALVVREGSDIDEVTDLVGKKVAAPFGATTHYHLLAALGLSDVDPEEVTILDLQPPDMLAAWQRGDIDAGFVWEPTLAKMLELGGRVLISSRRLAAEGFVAGDIAIVHRDFASAYPEILAKYLANQDRAVRYYREHPEESAEAVARQFGISQKDAARQMASLVMLTGPEQLDQHYLGRPGNIGDLAQIFKDTADFLARQRTIAESPDIGVFREAINPRYLVRALEERTE